MAAPGPLRTANKVRPVRSLGRSTWIFPILVSLVLTPLAMIAHHYKYVNDDQILYIPFLRRTLNPSLYPGDYFFDQPQASISLFEDLLAWPIRWIGLEWTMFLGYLLVQFTILLALFSLASRLAARRAGYLATILFILPISIGGTFVRTYDNYFNPRTLTLPLGLLTLVALWQRRPWPAAVLVGLHLLLHPLSGLHTWLATALLFAWWTWRRDEPRRRLAGPSLILVGVLAVLALTSGDNGGLWLDPAWRAVLRQRTPYVFLASWTAADWISMGLYLLLGLVGWSSRPRDPRTTELSLAILVVVLATTLAVALGVDGLGLAPLAQLQLARSWGLVLVLAVIFGADAVLTLYTRRGWGAILVATLLALAIYFDRADAAWQPVFAVLLLAIVTARAVERRWDRTWADGLLAVGGLVVVFLTLLPAWPAASSWPVASRLAHWSLPDETLWLALALFGLGWAVSKRGPAPGPSTQRRFGLGAGLILALVALFPLFETGLERDWPIFLNERLQVPFADPALSFSNSFRAWQDVQLWALAHTEPEARFATDPDEKGFRVFSERSPIVEEKDGAAAMFNRTYALEWDRRMVAMAATGVVDPDKKTELTEYSVEGLINLHQHYQFDYVVGRLPLDMPWPEVYRNDLYVVYAWPIE